MSLLPFDEASRRLSAAERAYRGIQEIPIARIVGSVDRADDFDRDFRARHDLSRGRLQQLREAAAVGALPAIVVFELGGAYFVEDGHHRVALAREQGADFIDAQVTSLLTDYEIGPDVDVCRLMHTQQQRQLLEDSGLADARPDALVTFTLIDGYTQLRDIIDAVRRADLPRLYASWHSTDADLFLWVYQLRRDLRAHDTSVDFTAAAQHARGLNLGYRRKRHHLREGRTPLPRRRT